MNILIIGASGSGTTTLGKELEKHTDFVHLDIDDYYWEKTQPPFQKKVPLELRNKNLKADYNKHENVVISGSLISWGTEWETTFDLAIFIYLENEERMRRLAQREVARYGKKLQTDLKTQQDSKAFLEWANQYENPNFIGRSLIAHTAWLDRLDGKVLKLDGAFSLTENTKYILKHLNISHKDLERN